ncbi:hypothetical protein ACFL1H_01585 [Nanoarchaeota archaeon]
MVKKILSKIGVGLLALGACSTANAADVDLVGSAGVDMIYINYDIGDAIQTTTLPDGLNAGNDNLSMKANVPNTFVMSPKVGVAGFVETNDYCFSLGTDVRFNLIQGQSKGGKGAESMVRYPLGYPYESYAYSRMKVGNLTYIPNIGLEKKISDNRKLGFKLGLPNSKFDIESGHHSNNMYNPVQNDSWKGKGISYGITYDKFVDNAKTEFFIKYEKYKPTFAGEQGNINALVFGATYNF